MQSDPEWKTIGVAEVTGEVTEKKGRVIHANGDEELHFPIPQKRQSLLLKNQVSIPKEKYYFVFHHVCNITFLLMPSVVPFHFSHQSTFPHKTFSMGNTISCQEES